MTSYEADKLIAVDIDKVMRDPALITMRDGPAKALLTTLGVELDYDEGEPPPMLIVRRS